MNSSVTAPDSAGSTLLETENVGEPAFVAACVTGHVPAASTFSSTRIPLPIGTGFDAHAPKAGYRSATSTTVEWPPRDVAPTSSLLINHHRIEGTHWSEWAASVQVITMAVATRIHDRSTEQRTVDDDAEVEALLGALQDDDCRSVLDATSDEPLSASELSSTCDLPLSTTYRKLDVLTEVGLLEERTRLHPDGKHASEYLRSVDDVLVSVDADGDFELTVSTRGIGDRPAGVAPAGGR
jgi:DNA-binding transcriptional ArsR family regulator